MAQFGGLPVNLREWHWHLACSGPDRLEACPTLQLAARFLAPTHVQNWRSMPPVNRRLHLCKLLLHMQQKPVVAGSWPRCAIGKSWELPMNRIAHSPHPQWPRNLNFVAADVRRLSSISDFG